MSDTTALEKRANTLPIGARAKLAVETYTRTGSGLNALNEFVFPSTIYGANGGSVGTWLGGNLGGWLSVSPRNFPYKNINAYNSSIVMACINFIEGAFREAIPTVIKQNDDNTNSVIPNHRIVKFLRRPNPYYNLSKLMTATLISYYLDGNAYWFKERADEGLGATKGLYYIPHYQITPKAENGEYIGWYEYNVNGKSYRIPTNRIVHFRNGLDPYNPLSGRKILDPVLSEIFTDEEAAMFIAALVRNTAIPGIVIMPDTDKVVVKAEDAEALKETFKRKFGGDNRGEPLITNFAAKVFQMGFSPEQLQFKETRRLPEERVAAQFRVPPIVAGLGAGLDKSTYSNYEQALTQAYRSAMIPLWDELADEIDTQLFPEFNAERKGEYDFYFDYSKVRALQESQDAINARTTRLWTTDVITRAEARGATGFNIEDSRDNVFYSDIRVKPGVTPPTAPAKAIPVGSPLLLKAGNPEDNLDTAFGGMLEADAVSDINAMEANLEGFYVQLGQEAEKEAKTALDPFNSEKEAERIYQTVAKTLGIALLLKAIWQAMGKSVVEDTIDSITLRLSIADKTFWDSDSQAGAKSLLTSLVNDYENSLAGQTKAAIAEAIKRAEQGESIPAIARRIKSMVEGREMYPGVFQEAYDKAKAAGATEEEAKRAGDSKARRYRAKLIAETETRTYQNRITLDGFTKAGVENVKVTDGDGCGWKNHNDTDKAHNTVRLVSEAKRYSLAHPNCKRRFYPAKK